MKLSFYGKAMHFYMWFGKFALKIIMILIFTLLVSLTLILTVPQFSLHKAGSEISHFIPLAIAQTVVSITFLVSLAGAVVFGLSAGFIALLEIPIEVLLKKRVYKLVKERQKMSVDELVRETGVLENDLSFLMKNWIIRPGEDVHKVDKVVTGMIKRGHLQIDLNAKELSWQEQL
jgi:hypothetical protein